MLPGSAKNAYMSRTSRPLAPVLIVNSERGASPEQRLPRLAPSWASSPSPSDTRRSSSAASFGRLETIVRPVSFSYQRKAGMSKLLPCRMPGWLAPVCDDRSHSQGTRRWVPDRIQRAIIGMWPLRSARRSVAWASPSISRKITPGTSVRAWSGARRIVRSTTRRWKESSSSIASSADSIVVNAASSSVATIALPSPSTLRPGRILSAASSTAPLRTSAPRPAV